MTSGRLRARTVRLDAPVDLHQVLGDRTDGFLFHRAGVGLVGVGVALRAQVHEVLAALGDAAVDDPVGQPGSGPVAFGALPFLPSDATVLHVPALTVTTAPDGSQWATAVASADIPAQDPRALVEDALAANAARPAAPGPDASTVVQADEPATDEWCQAVAAAVARIRSGALEKVVLARTVTLHAPVPFPLDRVLTRLRQDFAGSYVFAIDGMVGATPELLVERVDDVARSQPMAGSTPMTGDAPLDDERIAALLASQTYRHEHQVTIDMVHDTLLPYCSYLDDEAEPSVVRLPNVAHLATSVQGRLSTPPASVLELVRALHPTPAVCGRPRAEALTVIDTHETVPRGRYAGAVGWVDRHGNGTWAVTLRCAELHANSARLYAGCGLVADSEPTTELVESTAKLQVMLGALLGSD